MRAIPSTILVFAFVTQLTNGFGWFGAPPKELIAGAQESNLQMPGVKPKNNESYLCTAFALNTDETHYIVGFNPIADMHQVHHILLFGCDEPGSDEEVWDCGEMISKEVGYQRKPACTAQPNILYAWARGAPKLELPKGVGFRVGGDTGNKVLVLQVHYMHPMSQKDSSGVRVESTRQEQPRTAATFLLATGGEIQPKSTEQMEVACVMHEPVEIHPFAFRVHTHRHGVNVGGWVVRPTEEEGKFEWTLLGQRDPQLPELFEPVANKSIVISPDDMIAARCDMKNNENRLIKVGPTGEDEMCNFYMMYWVEGDRVLDENVCTSPGPPDYYVSANEQGMGSDAVQQ